MYQQIPKPPAQKSHKYNSGLELAGLAFTKRWD